VRIRTMMQACASATELRDGRPILWTACKASPASGHRRLGSSWASRRQPGRRGTQSRFGRLLYGVGSPNRTQDDTLRNLAGCHQLPKSDEQFSRQGDDHGLADGSAAVGRLPSVPLRQRASFWNIRKRHANWIMPRRTRALPALASPFSRRGAPRCRTNLHRHPEGHLR